MAERKMGKRPEPAGKKIYLDELAKAYIQDRKAAGVSEAYLQDFVNLMNNHVLPILCHKPVDDLIYHEDILKIAEHYSHRSTATRNRYFGYLRTVFRFGVRHGLTANNPLAQWKKTKETPLRPQLTVEDLQKIMHHAAPHLQWAIEAQWQLGTRPGASELLALKWEHVDFDRCVVWIYGRKTKQWRDIPISDNFKRRLHEMKARAKTPYVVEYQGAPVKKFCRSFQTACQRADIPYRVRMYDIRHLFASIMLQGGADLAAVSRLLGHSSTHMTANVYYQLLKGDKERAVELLPELMNHEAHGKDNVIQLRDRKE